MLQRSDLVEIAQGYTQLKKQGNEYLGRCPFHEERTPSFWVNPGKGVYHCFGCGASGDIIAFVREKQNLDFVEAVESLADRFRVQLEYEGADRPADDIPKRRLYELMEAATSFYESFLWQAGSADVIRKYISSRGISEETARAFRLGYSPDENDGMARRAKTKGYTQKELLEARLTGTKGNDFFRGRLMVPIVDRANRVLGFGARKLRDEQFGGKYMNSSDGRLFQKKRTIYTGPGLRSGQNFDSVIVVEGYMAVMALHQAGFPNACATMGTALTDEQLMEIRRLAPRAYFAFDPDPAGVGATVRALEAAEKHELDVQVLELPDGMDPADVIMEAESEGIEGDVRFRGIINRAQSLLSWRVTTLIAQSDLTSPSGQNKAYAEALKLFAAVPFSPERSTEASRIADRLHLRDPQLIARLERGGQGPRETGAPAPRRRLSPADVAVARSEKIFLAAVFRLVEGKEVDIQASPITSEHFTLDIHRRGWEALCSTTDNPLDITRIHSDSEMVGLVAELAAFREKEHLDGETDHALTVMNELQLRLQERHLSRRKADLKEELRSADDDTQLLNQLIELDLQLRAVRAELRDTPYKE